MDSRFKEQEKQAKLADAEKKAAAARARQMAQESDAERANL